MRGGRPARLRARRRPVRWSRLVGHPATVPLLLITIAVVAANGPYLVGAFDPDPLYQTAALTVAGTHHVLAGLDQIEPNTGFTAQALGHLAAQDWLRGVVPWWNPYEGVGAPLAGEMQSAALFPLVILDIFANGQVYFHLILELVAGYGTWFLLARLVRSRAAATAGAMVFALNGTFAWLFHAAGNPVAFLPLLVLGVEQCLDPAPHRGLRGWPVVALAVALSLYAGFPETAYIDGLFALLWLGVRASDRRGRPLLVAIGRPAAGVVAGVALSAPILAAFGSYLQNASVGPHSLGYADSWSNPRLGAPAELMPYLFGPIFGWGAHDPTHRISTFWGEVGGYTGVSLVVVALLGLTGRRLRGLRLGLAAWVALGMARSFGVPVALQVVNAIPGVSRIVFYRYADPSWSLGLVVLAALAIDDLAGDLARTRRLVRPVLAALATLAAVAAAGVVGFAVLRPVYANTQKDLWAASSIAFAVFLALVCLALAVGPTGRLRRVALSAVIVIEACTLFVVPELSAPRAVVVDTGPVQYLQAHLDGARFYTLGPIAPNYGSYWQIAEADINDLPIPSAYGRYITTSLDPNVNPLVFTGGTRLHATGPSPAEALGAHLSAYEAIGVRYVVALTSTALPPGLSLPAVYRDRDMVVYALPDPAPMYGVSAGCRVLGQSLASVSVTCERPGTLIRRELYMPGWSAAEDGHGAAIRRSGPLFQAVGLAPGTHRLNFSYQPPHTDLAVAAVVAALAAMAVTPIRRRRRTRPRAAAPAPAAPRRCSAPSPTS